MHGNLILDQSSLRAFILRAVSLIPALADTFFRRGHRNYQKPVFPVQEFLVCFKEHCEVSVVLLLCPSTGIVTVNFGFVIKTPNPKYTTHTVVTNALGIQSVIPRHKVLLLKSHNCCFVLLII